MPKRSGHRPSGAGNGLVGTYAPNFKIRKNSSRDRVGRPGKNQKYKNDIRCYGKNHPDRRPADRQTAPRPLCRFAAPPRGVAELRRVREDLHHDRRRAGAHRQRRQPRKGAPEHHRGRARLPGLRPRPRTVDALHPVADPRTVRTGVLLHEPRHRGPSATQPDREGRNPVARLLGEQRGERPATAGHSRRVLHLPHFAGVGHHRFPRHDRPRRRGSGADARTDARDRPQVQRGLRPHARRAGNPAAPERRLHAPARHTTARPRCPSRWATAST